MEAAEYSQVTDHYARGDLVDSIREALAQLGKSENTVTTEDLSSVDEFHIGGRITSGELAHRLAITASDLVLDIGCGIGGPARQFAESFGCHVTGIDLTYQYVEAGNVLSNWLRLSSLVNLKHGNALALPLDDGTFTVAYILHVGMNIFDKHALFAEAARVLRPGGRIGIFDVMRTSDGDLAYPLPWASAADTNSIDRIEVYRHSLAQAGFQISSERNCREVALNYFERQRAQVTTNPSPLGIHLLVGERRPEMVRNMSDAIAAGWIAPVEIVAKKR